MARGSIRKRGEQRYQLRVSLGRCPDTGRRLRVERSFSGTLREAEAALADLVKAHHAGQVVEPSRQTLNAYLHRWVDEAKERKLAPKTLENYRHLIDRHLAGDLGKTPLANLRPLAIQSFYNELDGYSFSLRRQVHVLLSGALRQAVRWQLLERNPVDAVEPPRGRKRKRKEFRALTQEEGARFLQAAEADPWSTLWFFLLGTGCRPAEAYGLQWPQVDLRVGRVQIVQTLFRPKTGGWQLEPPKTGDSHRSIDLPEGLVERLRAHRTHQAEQRLARAAPYDDHGFVFATAGGSPAHHSNLSRRHFKPTLERAGLPAKFRVYDLRHTHATWLLEQGEPVKVVAERLGNSVQLCLTVYSHVTPTMQARAARALEGLGLFR